MDLIILSGIAREQADKASILDNKILPNIDKSLCNHVFKIIFHLLNVEFVVLV